MPRFQRFGARLGVIAGGALVIRIGVVLTDWRRTQKLGPTDEFGYSAAANLFAKGYGWINPFFFYGPDPAHGGKFVDTASHPPLFTLVLSFFSLLGVDTPLGHRFVNLFIGVALVVAIGFLGRELAGDRAGLVAAALAAVYPHLWINDTAIMPETLFSLCVVLALLVGYRCFRTPTVRLALGLGALVSLAALTRSEGVLLFPFMALPFILCARGISGRRKLQLTAVVAAVGVLLIGPWVLRNLVTFEEPTFMASGSSNVLAVANCDPTYSGELFGYWDIRCGPKKWPPGDESVIDKSERKAAIDYISDHLDRLPVVMLARIGRMWDIYRPAQNIELNATWERRGLWPSRLATGMYFLMIIPALFGLIVMRRRKLPISPILGLVFALTLTAAVTIGITRYRAPVDAVLPVLTAVGVEGWLTRRRRDPSSATADDPPDAVEEPVGAPA
jgi:4-amino-4-deoxy-L-arabinose transferase-like glycosyltransferase